jgi:RimJ/RimL family protein N-acetyltransferase
MESPDIVLRPYTLDDAVDLYDAAREALSEGEQWMPWCHPGYSLEEARSQLATQISAFQQESAFEFAITSADGHYLGSCGLNRIDGTNRRANLGYWVRTSVRGKGVATSAVQLLRDWGFQHTDLVCLELAIPVGNTASYRVAEKAGATYEGTLRSRLLIRGVPHDTAIFSFLRPGAVD